MLPIIEVRNLSKRYRLGAIGMTSLHEELNRWWERLKSDGRRETEDRRRFPDAPYPRFSGSPFLRFSVSAYPRFSTKRLPLGSPGRFLRRPARRGGGHPFGFTQGRLRAQQHRENSKSAIRNPKCHRCITRQTAGEITLRGRVASLIAFGSMS